MIDVSIIIINHNTFKLTCNCIQSVIRKTEGINYEIILVDNASSDVNPDLFKERFPFINLIKSKINSGFAKGNNLGINHAQGEYILLLNSDTELFNNAIKITYDKIKLEPTIGVISAKLISPDGKVQNSCQRFPSIKYETIELLRLHKLFSRKKQGELLLGAFFSHTYETEPDWVWGTFFMFRRTILNKFPETKLTETFFMYMEDVEWCYIIRQNGFKIVYYPEAVVIHHGGGSAFLNSKAKKDEQMYKNEIKFMKLYYGYFRCTMGILIKKINAFIYSTLH